MYHVICWIYAQKEGAYISPFDIWHLTRISVQIILQLRLFSLSQLVLLLSSALTVSAAKGLDKDEEDKKGKYIRKERYAGAMQRSFYVGENLTQEDIKAKYEKCCRLFYFQYPDTIA